MATVVLTMIDTRELASLKTSKGCNSVHFTVFLGSVRPSARPDVCRSRIAFNTEGGRLERPLGVQLNGFIVLSDTKKTWIIWGFTA